MRGHGNNLPHFVSMGYNESKDLACVVEYLYQKYGYDGLKYIPIGRPRKTPIMKKSLKNNTQLTEEEREEISRLKAEIERLKVDKLFWLALIIIIVFGPCAYIAINTKSPWVSNDTFSFDIYNSYTFNHYNAYEDDDYEFDCYKLSSKVISEISKNPPQYFIYNQKKYEVDNVNLDYFGVDLAHEDEDLVEDFGITNKILKEYNAIIFWNDYDGKYHHFDSVMILDGAEGFILYKYIDFSNFNY